MLKIYNAYADNGEIKVEDFITFENGMFNTGLDGFGEVYSGDQSCQKANYTLQSLQNFKIYVNSMDQEDGWISRFIMFRPISYATLDKKYKDIEKTYLEYEKNGLNEEGILLFTNFISLTANDKLTQRIFGRCPGTGLYLLLPNASISMKTISQPEERKENYEVLQSQSFGKQLVLTKLNRRL